MHASHNSPLSKFRSSHLCPCTLRRGGRPGYRIHSNLLAVFTVSKPIMEYLFSMVANDGNSRTISGEQILRFIRINVGWIRDFEIVKLPMKRFTIYCTTNYFTIQLIFHENADAGEAQKEVEKAAQGAREGIWRKPKQRSRDSIWFVRSEEIDEVVLLAPLLKAWIRE